MIVNCPHPLIEFFLPKEHKTRLIDNVLTLHYGIICLECKRILTIEPVKVEAAS